MIKTLLPEKISGEYRLRMDIRNHQTQEAVSRDEVALDRLVFELVEAVEGTMQPEYLSIWLQDFKE